MSDQKGLLKKALDAIDALTEQLRSARARPREPIAVVGMSCRFPGGIDTPADYWRLLREGRSGIGDIPPDRWDVDAFYDPDLAPGTMYTRRGGFLERLDGFDAPFFRISPREAATLDPQHRLLLECAWEALEDAGEAPDRLVNSETGVFVGITASDYARLLRIGLEDSDVYSATGTALNAAAGRIAFFLGLQGPCMSIDTACSSSLVAAHTACQSLRAGECDRALVGGVNAILSPEAFVLFSKWGMVSRSGECRAFDDDASGFVRGEGCGVLVLKRLSDAQAAGDQVHAVILGSAVNQDGASSGLSVPNGPAQVKAIKAALERAGVEPADVGFVEAHGTGTSIGDPIEIEALGEAYGPGHTADRPLLVGSVKSSIGHLESAAGVAGLIKLVLVAREGELPPQLSYERPSSRIDWDRLPVRVAQRGQPWPSNGRRVGAVSGFGFTGTNAHLVVASPPPVKGPPPSSKRYHILPISARSPKAVSDIARRLATVLEADSPPQPVDVERTLAIGRARLRARAAVVGTDAADLAAKLRALADETPSAGVVSGSVEGDRPRPVVFVYTGQGSQYPGMGLELCEAFPVFRAAFERCADMLRYASGPDLTKVLSNGSDDAIHATAVTQPAIFALEYALTELYRSWGIRPAAVLGHSVGELVAACVAGVFGLEDALRLIAERGRLMQALPAGGGMIAVAAHVDVALDVAEPFRDLVSLAAINGPEDVVLSGALPALEQIATVLRDRGVKSKRLTVSHAFHSPLMEPMRADWLRALRSVSLSAPAIPLVSNLSGTIDPRAGTTAEYWSRHVREPVAFEPSMRSLAEGGHRVFLEIGPKPVLLGLARRFVNLPDAAWVPSLRGRAGEPLDVLESLGGLFVSGQRPDWEALLDGAGRRISLPTYAFQRERHWAAARPSPGGGSTAPTAAARVVGLLGPLIRSPAAAYQFECALHPTVQPVLDEHRVAGRPVFPAAGYIELVRAAAREVWGEGPVRLEEGRYVNALALGSGDPAVDEDPPADVRLLLTPVEGRSAEWEVFSRPATASPADPWSAHASGRVLRGPAPEPFEEEQAILRRCSRVVDIDEYQGKVAALGLEYGPAFRSLERAWGGEGEAFGLVRLPEGVSTEGFGLHPGLLDAAFHLIGLAHRSEQSDQFLLPVGFDAVEIYQDAGTDVRAHCVVREAGPSAVRVDMALFRGDGTPVARIDGLETRPITRAQFARAIRRGGERVPLLAVGWREWHAPAPEGLAGEWLVLADDDAPPVSSLVRALESAGATVRRLPAGHHDVDPTWLAPAEGKGPRGVIDLRPIGVADPMALSAGASLDGASAKAPSPLPSELLGGALGPTVSLFRAMAARAQPSQCRLVVVTSRAQRVVPADRVNPAASALWGLAATAEAELPECEVMMIDLEGPTNDDVGLIAAILAQPTEDRLALRDGRWFVARLEPVGAGAPFRNWDAFAVTAKVKGDISGITFERATRPSPGPGQVEIEVLASGLNFRDVLCVLDMYPGEPGPLGNECCGRIASLGPDVDGLHVGDLVTCISEGTFGSHVLAARSMVFPVPAELSIAQSAVFPIAYLTAYLALYRLGSIRSGQRVLIHSAAGGVGLAAFQLARAAGAEVFATAGSPEKRDLLRRLGAADVWDSREVLPHQTVLEATGGDGLDLILNSLTGEAIDEGIRSLSIGGRFLEIGLRELRRPEEVAAVRKDVAYVPLLLGDWCKNDPDAVRAMWADLMKLLHDRVLPTPRVHRFPLREVHDAFRFMARARHVGRIALVHEHAAAKLLRADAAYVVTGGLGALGLQVAEWLAGQGAGELVLMGRSGPNESARGRIASMERTGAKIRVVNGDVTDAAALCFRRDLDESRHVRGIVHAAGVADDASLSRHDAARVRRVVAPKADGAVSLVHAAQAADTDLDFLALFSSGSAVLGSPGQAAYAAANAFLDGLAHRLRSEGRSALSIGWGAWEGQGMAEKVDARTLERWAAAGIGTLSAESALAALDDAMRLDQAYVAVLPIRWGRLLSTLERTPALLRDLGERDPAGVAGQSLDRPGAHRLSSRLAELPEEVWRPTVVEWLRAEMAAVVGLRPDALDPDKPTDSLGLDSLMALEIRNRIEAELGLVVPTARLLEHPSVADVAEDLLALLDRTSLVAAAARAGQGMVEGEI